MKTIAFTSKIAPSEKPTLEACMKILECPYQAYNIPQHRPEDIIGNNCVVFAFGSQTKTLCDQYMGSKKFNSYLIELPNLKLLEKNKKNAEYRKNTYSVLLEWKEKIKEFVDKDIIGHSDLSLSKSDLSDKEEQCLFLLSKILASSPEKRYLFKTDNNLIAEVVSSEKYKSNEADICFCIEEIYTIRLIMDLLNVKEVSIVDNK